MKKIIKPNKKSFLLYNDIDWNEMPFPKKWFDGVLMDKVNPARGYLKATVFDHSKQLKPKDTSLIINGGKKIHEEGGDNQIMYWLKHAYSMLQAGVFYSDSGEHIGYIDGGETTIDETSMPSGWKYFVESGEYVYSTHAWKTSSDSMAINTDIANNTLLYPFFPTKMRFGTQGPVDITTPIDPSETTLEDFNSQGAGENGTVTKNNFIMISRTQHIALTTTGYSTTAPSGYYDNYGSVFKNITVYQVTMPASATSYIYDGKQINEAGLFNDVSLTGTKGGLYDQANGMLLAKRYFSPIQKTNTISINWQWSIVT
jgi:hypothetical protein